MTQSLHELKEADVAGRLRKAIVRAAVTPGYGNNMAIWQELSTCALKAADGMDALIADYERMRGALERQADNMAFVLNRVDLPESWLAKFNREMTEDCQALASIKGKTHEQG